MAIRTIPSLRKHLQWAIELEHATIPPYLCALYSLHEGKNSEAEEVLLSIVMEEMLHMTLAANVLNAVGGRPQLDDPHFVPKSPAYLPHSNRAFQVSLSKLSPESVEVFLRIEKPEEHGAVPEEENYETIGQFYEAIEEGLTRLCHHHGESGVFSGDPSRQLGPESFWYGGGGKVIEVQDLDSARRALEEIIEQGEGLDFQEILGRRPQYVPSRAGRESPTISASTRSSPDGAIKKATRPRAGRPGRRFPSTGMPFTISGPIPGSATTPGEAKCVKRWEAFNRVYSDMLRLLHQSFNGQPEQMAVAVGEMYEIKSRARELVRTPTGDGETTACPSFEYVAPEAVEHVGEAARKIVIRPNGPYIVHGGIPMRRKHRVFSEHKEALTWRKEEVVEMEGTYALCRCGQSSAKPFCDGTHARIDFDGTETAGTEPRADRAVEYPGTGITVRHDRTIPFSTFCENRLTDSGRWRRRPRTRRSARR